MLLKYAASVSLNHKRLANALGIHSTTLSRRLSSRSTHPFTLIEVKQLIELLTREGALSSVRQARELLHLLYPENDFTKEELALPPLSKLSLLPSDNHKGYPTGEVVAVQDLIIKPRPGLLQRRGIKTIGPGLDEGGGGAGQHGSSSGGLGAGAARWDEDNEDRTPGLIPLTTGVPLIGRDKELEQARNWLADKANPVKVLTIAGPGGVGKTSLATALARQLLGSGEYPDGVVWVDLTLLPVGTTPRELNEAIAHAMGLTLQVGVAVSDQLKNYLAGKRLLVLLDNFEQLQSSDMALLLRRITTVNPGLRVVVTSRQALQIPAISQTLKLAPLTYPRVGESLPPVPELAERYSAVELFIRQARLVEPDFALTEGNAGAVVELCQKLDGVPLAIAIAAARVSQFGVAGVLSQINRHGALPILEDDGQEAERHQSQAAAIGWSYDLLTEEERRVWRGLAVFAGSVGIEAIERVLGEGLSAVEVDTRLVAGLVDKSMLFKVEDSIVGLAGSGIGSGGLVGESRYYLHGVMREYALDRMRKQAGEEDKVREAHARYYLGVAEEAGARLNGPDRVGWSGRLGVEYENVRAALGWLVEKGMVEEAYRLVGAMGQYWFNNRLTAEGQTWLERVLGLIGAGEVSKAVRARVLFEAGRMAMAQEDWGKARAWSEESLGIWRELGNDEGLGRVLTNLGNISLKAEDFEIARGYYEQALGYAEKLGNKVGLAAVTRNIGYIALRQNDLAKAKQFYQQSLELSQENGNRQEIVICWMNLGLIALKQGNLSEAQTFSYQTLLLSQELSDTTQEIYALLHLGQVASLRNDLAGMKGYYGRGLELCQGYSETKFIPSFLTNIAAYLLANNTNLPTIAKILGVVDYQLQSKASFKFDAEDRVLYKRVNEATRASLQEFEFLEFWMHGQNIGKDSGASIELGLTELRSLL